MANSEKLGANNAAQPQEKTNFVTKTINFFKTYHNIVYGVLIGILVIVAGWLAFSKFYLTPRNEQAAALIVKPIEYFMRGDSASLNLALEGDAENDGFLSIAENYSITKTANTANYYAGLTYLKLNNKEEALTYLLKFKKKESILWYNVQALIGDLYDDMDDQATAKKYYKKACKSEDAFFAPIALFKLAQMYEREENWKEAVKTYQTIEEKFYDQYINMGIEKCVERAKVNAQK